MYHGYNTWNKLDLRSNTTLKKDWNPLIIKYQHAQACKTFDSITMIVPQHTLVKIQRHLKTLALEINLYVLVLQLRIKKYTIDVFVI